MSEVSAYKIQLPTKKSYVWRSGALIVNKGEAHVASFVFSKYTGVDTSSAYYVEIKYLDALTGEYKVDKYFTAKGTISAKVVVGDPTADSVSSITITAWADNAQDVLVQTSGVDSLTRYTGEDSYKPDVPDESYRFNLLDSLLDGVLNSDDGTTGVVPIDDAGDDVTDGANESTPLVLDIDGNGIELASLSSADAVYFDLNNDGFAEATGWVKGGDGLLALDVNGDGIINRSTELFGNQTGHVNGFLALAEHDTNGDGQITAEDAAWDDLRVWIDANQNGYTEEGELRTLDDLGITQIGTSYEEVDITKNGNDIRQSGTFTMNGEVRDIVDVYFQVNLTNSLYNLEFEFDESVIGLPGLRGYGQLPALYIAMSLDNDQEDPDSLISLVDAFSIGAIGDLFTADTSAIDDVREILFRWAGVEGTVAGSRGVNVNATELAFLEKLTGQPWLQHGAYPNPGYRAGYKLTTAFETVLNHFAATLMAQGAAWDLFEGNERYYDIHKDGFVGVTGLNLSTLGDLETTATGLSTTGEKTVFWTNVVRVIEYAHGIDNLSGAEQTALDDAINNSDGSLDLETISGLLISASTWNDIAGTGGADTLTGGSGSDEINAGNDADTLTGAGGDDFLIGGAGNDVYVYNSGDGDDVIFDTSGTDKILFGAGIDAGDLTLTRMGSDLVIDIDNGVDVGQIVIADHFVSGRAIDSIDFNGSSTLDLTNINNWVLDGNGNAETLHGVRVNGGPDDIINGNGGNDYIYGHEGDDTLHGNDGADYINAGTGNDIVYGDDGNDRILAGSGDDTVYGGDGNDVIYGGFGDNVIHMGAGNDTVYNSNGDDSYYYTSGHDTIREAGAGVDTIYLPSGFDFENAVLYRSGADLKIYLSDADSITIKLFFGSNGYKVEYLNFDGGPSIYLPTATLTEQGDEGNNSLVGGSGNDTLMGFGGNDTITGNDGDDVLVGGHGHDTLTGGNGDDTLDGGSGNDSLVGGNGDDTYIYVSGQDYINDTGTTTSDVIEFAQGFLPEDVLYERYVSDLTDLVLNLGGSNSITLNNQFGNTSQNKIETLHFADDTTLTVYDQIITTYGDENNNTIAGVFAAWSPYNIIYGNGGNDTITGDDNGDTIYGGTGNDVINGWFGADVLHGDEGDDTLNGYYGDDIMHYSSGNDVFVEESGGGGGYDILMMDAQWSPEDLTGFVRPTGTSHAFIDLGGGNSITLYNWYINGSHRIEEIKFADGTIVDPWSLDELTVIQGTSGGDTITGTTGDDTIDGGAGADTMSGLQGNDTYIVDDAGDVVNESSSQGTDTIMSSVSYALPSHVENIILTGSGDIDATGNSLNNTLQGNSGTNTLTGGTGNDTYIYDDPSDTLVENAAEGEDTVMSSLTFTLAANFENLVLTGDDDIDGTGNSDANTMQGNAGTNTLSGGDGNDTYVFDDPNDVFVENPGEGTDTVIASISATIGDNIENLTLAGSDNLDGTGNAAVNILTGNSGNNTLDGGTGADTMIGGLGDDSYIVDDASDVVTESSSQGTDTVYSSASSYTLGSNVENLVLTGSSGINGTGNTLANTIIGNSGVNTLSGDSGNDWLDGGEGADSMAGGAGNDTFIVDNAGDILSETSGTDTVMSSVSWTLATGFENLTLTGSDSIDGTGNTAANTLQGNSGVNTLAGGTGNDTYILGNAADVVVEGAAAGTDIVFSDFTHTLSANVENLTLTGADDIDATGNSSNNTLTGNSGTNTLTGGAGNDTYIVQNASDIVVENAAEGTDVVQSSVSYTLSANVENLTLTGTDNIDATGNSGVNTLTGNAGNNTLDGGAGADRMVGSHGNDTYIVDNASDVLVEASGVDTVMSSVAWTLGSGFENLILTGSSDINGTGNTLANTMIGNSGVNVLNAGTGTVADTLDGGEGADTLIGGAGDDVYFVDNAGDTVTENAAEGNDTVYASISYTLAANVENLVLTGSGDLNATGNSANNTLQGNTGTNTLTGGAGDDTYVVDSASDVVVESAAEGADTVMSSVNWTLGADVENLVLTGTDHINGTGNADANSLTGNAGNNTLDGGAGADAMAGGAGDDYYFVDDAGDTVTEGASAGTDTVSSSVSFTLGTNVENLTLTGGSAIDGTGNTSDNVIIGNGAVNTLTGNNGNDTLDGGAGADSMSGGAGNDTYYVDDAGDTLSEVSGTDTVFSSVSWTLATGFEHLTLTGSGNIDATGNTAANTLIGNSGNNSLDGSSGADNMQGGAGDDVYVVDNASDTIVENESEGTDTVLSSVTHTLSANVENLTLTGSSNVHATGNASVNILTGNSGNNSLDGGAGADTMTGGTGNDTYVVDDAGDVVVESAAEGTDIVRASVSYTLGADVEHLVLTGIDNINGTGNADANSLTGNIGKNTLDGGAGADIMIGGAGDDAYIVDNASDTVTELANEGVDTVFSSINLTIGSNVENLTLTGSSAINGTGNSLDNIITGNSGVNTLTGDAGSDTLNGGADADTMIGGTGDDTYYVDDAGDVVTESSAEGTDTVISGISYTLGDHVENLVLSGTGDIDGTGNALDNTIVGNSGTNTLTGGLGDDTYVVDSDTDVVVESSGEGTDTVMTAISWTLGDHIENLVLTGYDDADGTGNGLDNIITGNDGINTLSGGDGSDTLDGGLEADTLVGGDGNDLYIVDNAGDVIIESVAEGTDSVQSNVSYTLSDNVENLTLTGDRTVNGTGNSSVNIITGNANNNTLDGGEGADTLTGGDGNDTYIVDNAGDIVTEGADEGTDTVLSSVTWTLGSNFENLTLTGSGSIDGTGNAANNTLTGNEGVNTLTGGDGDDTYVIGNASDVVAESAAEGMDTVVSAFTWTLGSNFENLVLTGSGDIDGTGNSVVNIMTGNDGDNTLDGGADADTLDGGAGDDTFIVDDAGDVVIGGAGDDTVLSSVSYAIDLGVENLTLTGSGNINATGNAGNNTLQGNSGTNTLAGGDGDDTYVYDDAADTLVESEDEGIDTILSSFTLTLDTHFENLTLVGGSSLNGTGNASDNVIIGNTAVNTLSGGDGNDTLDGGEDADTLVGGDGDDVYIVDNVGDVVTESVDEGTDTVYSSLTWTLGSNFENLVLTGDSSVNGTGNALDNAMTGNEGVNTLSGGDGNDTLDGGAEADTLIGGTGDDTYVVDDAGDVVSESSSEGTDTVMAWVDWALGDHVENLTLLGFADIDGTGNASANVISGNYGVNTISGGVGDDTIDGGWGADTLTGGDDADVFLFMSDTAYSGVDAITDFTTGDGDAIDVSDLLSEYNELEHSLADFVKFDEDGGDSIMSIDRDGQGEAYGWEEVALLQGVTGLSDVDTLVTNGNLIVS